jgi:hypothetical protein
MKGLTYVNCCRYRQTINEPKALTGSSQKAMRPGVPFRSLGTRGQWAVGIKAETSSSMALLGNTVSPIPRLIQRQALPQGMLSEVAGKGCWRKRRRPCNAVDSGCVVGDIVGYYIIVVRKHAYFQRVVDDERVCRTTLRGNVI